MKTSNLCVVELAVLANDTSLNICSFDIHFATVIEIFTVALLVNAPVLQEICSDAHRDYGSRRDRQRRRWITG